MQTITKLCKRTKLPPKKPPTKRHINTITNLTPAQYLAPRGEIISGRAHEISFGEDPLRLRILELSAFITEWAQVLEDERFAEAAAKILKQGK